MRRTFGLIFAVLFFQACSGMSATEQRVLSGGAIGAGGGALIGAAAGSAALGAAVGGGAGLLGGYAYDRYQKAREIPRYRETASSTAVNSNSGKKSRPKRRPKREPAAKPPENPAPQDTGSASFPHAM